MIVTRGLGRPRQGGLVTLGLGAAVASTTIITTSAIPAVGSTGTESILRATATIIGQSSGSSSLSAFSTVFIGFSAESQGVSVISTTGTAITSISASAFSESTSSASGRSTNAFSILSNGSAFVLSISTKLRVTFLNTANGSSLSTIKVNGINSLAIDPSVGFATSNINALLLKKFDILTINIQTNAFTTLLAEANFNYLVANGFSDASIIIFDLIKKTPFIVYYEPKTNVFYEIKSNVFYEPKISVFYEPKINVFYEPKTHVFYE